VNCKWYSAELGDSHTLILIEHTSLLPVRSITGIDYDGECVYERAATVSGKPDEYVNQKRKLVEDDINVFVTIIEGHLYRITPLYKNESIGEWVVILNYNGKLVETLLSESAIFVATEITYEEEETEASAS